MSTHTHDIEAIRHQLADLQRKHPRLHIVLIRNFCHRDQRTRDLGRVLVKSPAFGSWMGQHAGVQDGSAMSLHMTLLPNRVLAVAIGFESALEAWAEVLPQVADVLQLRPTSHGDLRAIYSKLLDQAERDERPQVLLLEGLSSGTATHKWPDDARGISLPLPWRRAIDLLNDAQPAAAPSAEPVWLSIGELLDAERVVERDRTSVAKAVSRRRKDLAEGEDYADAGRGKRPRYTYRRTAAVRRLIAEH